MIKKINQNIFKIHSAIKIALASNSGLVGKIFHYFITNIYRVKMAWNLALFLFSVFLLAGILIPFYLRIIGLIALFSICYNYKVYEDYIHFHLGLILEYLLGRYIGGPDYSPNLKYSIRYLFRNIKDLNFLKTIYTLLDVLNVFFCYIHRIIIIFILISINNRIFYFLSYAFLIGSLLFLNLSFYFPLLTIWIILANLTFFYFDQTYFGFINNLGKYNPEIDDRKLAISKRNIIAIQYWITRRFTGGDILCDPEDVCYRFIEKDPVIIIRFDDFIRSIIQSNYNAITICDRYNERKSFF